jgi:ABC-2 type transport system ATP-binding protein
MMVQREEPDMTDQVVISAEGLTRYFNEIRAVQDVSFRVKKGEVFGFLGHNGAGKTTTVRLLNGLLKPTQGFCRVWDLSPLREGPTLRSLTGVLPETPSLEERLTGWENLSYYADLYGVRENEVDARIQQLMKQFGIIDRANDPVKEYSKGMIQRLALARALLHNPPLLFLDEPTSGLDPVSSRQVREMIAQLSQAGHTVFLCTHNLREAQQLCHRVAVLYQGWLVALGTPEELSERVQDQARLEIEVGQRDQTKTASLLEARGYDYAMEEGGAAFKIRGVGRPSIPSLVKELTVDGVKIYKVSPQEPSLEDIYFALHEKLEEKA